MKKSMRFALSLLLFVAGTVASWADFKDFSVQVNNQAGTLLTAEETATQGTAFEFGVAVAADGTVSRVTAADASSVATVSGQFHSDHGATKLAVTVPVDGAVKITVGQCTFSGSAINVKNSAGETVVTKTPGTACWKNDRTNVTELYYTGDATTLTISGMGYCPYVAVEKADVVIQAYDITYALGTETGVEGVVPDAVKWTEGDVYTIPKNYTLYKEGYTLTGWNDGTATVAVGAEYTPAADVTMTPVFTKNNVALADRTEAVTLLWDFQTKNGAPTLSYQNKPGIYVAQAVVNGETIDVKTSFTTDNGGKIANANWTDWCQMNAGTTFTLPSCKGAAFTLESSSATTTTTVDGIAAEGNANTTYSTEIASKAETIDVVIGNGSYFRYLKMVLPVVAQEGGKTFNNKEVTVTFAMNDTEDPGKYTLTPVDVQGGFSTVAFDYGNNVIKGLEKITDINNVTVCPAGLKINPVNGKDDLLYWNVKPAAGLTFTPTQVTGFVNRSGTDSENGLTVSVKQGDNAAITLGTWTALRSGKGYNPDDPNAKAYDKDGIAQYVVDLTAEQQAALAGSDMFQLMATIGVGNNKQGDFGTVTITGLLNGTMADVNKYAVSIAAAPAEGGSVTIYPNSEEYEENDEVTLTATENFGYDFVNWTDQDGTVISEEPKCKYTVVADAALTANFRKVNTYALDIAVEGGAKDYMISYSPAYTLVDGKKMYEEGTNVTVSAASNEVIKFASWSDGQTAAEISCKMTEDVALTATYSSSDFIAIWDFNQAGNNGRIADFSAEGNEAAALVMRDEAGNTAGWLDKSEVNGGYEGRPGGVCWKNDVAIGTYYWQTKVDASNFTALKVKSAMVYNYNAYQTYNVEYSLDGEEWTLLGAINMPGAKSWTDLAVDVPATADNKAEVYFRWIADKNSSVNGTPSQNDGACIGIIYITGTEKIFDDGKAPAIVGSVPAEGSNTASANGKVVITFDKKVQLTTDAKATLGTTALKPVVSGTAVVCEYKGLAYSTDYVFTLKGNSVVDLTGNNKVADDIVINFTTRTKPEVEKGIYDAVVATGEELAAAIKAGNERADKSARYRIFVKQGDIKIPAYDGDVTVEVTLANGTKEKKTYKEPRTYITGNNISIIGESYENTVITNSAPTETYQGQYGPANIAEGIGNSDVFINSSTGLYIQGVTVKTALGDAVGRDIAFQDKGNKTIMKDACLWGYQDTYVSNSDKSKYYFEGGVLRGRTDFLCGKGDVFYNQVTLRQVAGGYLAVPSVPKKYGYVFESCKIVSDDADPSKVNGKYTLGRPWGSGTPIARFINTVMEVAPSAVGWSEMSNGWPAQFAEYNSRLSSGTVVDLSQRKKTFGNGHANNPVMTAEEVAEYSVANVMGQDDDWDPTALTEQASAPKNVTIAGTDMTWDDSNYVLCWAVCKDGKVVDFTVEPSFTVDDASAEWSVRAANEMGGLGEAAVATAGTGISNVETGNAANLNTVSKFVENGKVVIVKDGKKFSAAGQMLK
ncbi:MAG: Ig-like domain-containing protein [Clostridium sp.]|nr:Ig-like domain-containing protein [Clostridium sp.]